MKQYQVIIPILIIKDMALNTNKLWKKIVASENYQKWHRSHDAFEEIAIIKSWCDYEDYDVSSFCKNADEVVCLYCYLHFVLDIEFLADAQSMAEDIKYEDYFKFEVKNAQLLINMLNE